MAVSAFPSPAAAESYRLGVQDKLRIKIVEWRAGQATYQEWTALASDYTVNTEGAVSLPLLGEIPATGMTTEEVAAAIAERLQQRANLLKRPDVSVEIVQFRPIYVMGEVEKPGEYPYRPDLTALEALGIAGGMYRPRDSGFVRLERDRITARSEIDSVRVETHRVVARRARLEAELAGEDKIAMPPELREDTRTATALIAEETAIMVARNAALKSKLAALADLKELYQREVVTLDSKIVAQDKQVALARREAKGVGSLVEKGLASTSREFAIERTVTELESQVLDYQTAALRAKQEIRKAERDALELQNDRKTKLQDELQDVRSKLDQLAVKLKLANALLNEIATAGPQIVSERSTKRTPVFSILRKSGGAVQRVSADENTAVLPGDVVRVETSSSDY